MRRLDVDQLSGPGVRPLVALASAGEHERIHLVILDDAEVKIAIVRRCAYGTPIVQGLAPVLCHFRRLERYRPFWLPNCVRSIDPKNSDEPIRAIAMRAFAGISRRVRPLAQAFRIARLRWRGEAFAVCAR